MLDLYILMNKYIYSYLIYTQNYILHIEPFYVYKYVYSESSLLHFTTIIPNLQVQKLRHSG
jgi:hypothetical protein